MASRFRDSSLILSIIFCGTLIGGFAYSHAVSIQVYVAAPQSAVLAIGPYGIREEVFWMFMHPILVATFVVTAILNWKVEARRNLIVSAIGIYCIALVATHLYFIREMVAFAITPQSQIPISEWMAHGVQWQRLSWMRGGLMYAAEISLLLALMRPGLANPEHSAQ